MVLSETYNLNISKFKISGEKSASNFNMKNTLCENRNKQQQKMYKQIF